MRPFFKMNRSTLIALVSAAVPAISTCANTLDFTLAPNPTISVVDGQVIYDSDPGAIDATGTATTLADPGLPGGSLNFDSGSIVLEANVDLSGNYVFSGAGLILTGGLDLDGDHIDDVNGTLLKGFITNFGSDPAGPAPVTFTYEFRITSGLLTQPIPLSGGGTHSAEFTVGSLGGAIFTADQQTSGILGDFHNDFSGNASEGTVAPLAAAVPLPTSGAMGLVLLAGTMVSIWSRRKSA